MGIISTQAFTFRLIANGQQLDLFEDEDIQLSNNVTGLFDLGVLPSMFMIYQLTRRSFLLQT